MLNKTRPLLALLTLSLAASAGALGTTAGTTISNTGTVAYTTDDGVTSTQTSTVSATVAQVYAVSVTPDNSITTPVTPGQVVYTPGNTTAAQQNILTYTLSNPGNGTDTFNVTTSAVSANVVAANIRYFADTNNNGVYDAGTDVQITAPVSLPADGSIKFFAVYTTPANTTGGTNFDITPAGTSVGDSSKTDINNLGRITQKSLYDLSFGSLDAKTDTTPGTVTYAQTVTNTGNVNLNASSFALSATPVDTTSGSGAFTQTYTVTIAGATSAPFATPQAALNAALGAGTIAPAGSFILNSAVTANSTLSSGNKEVLTLGAAIAGVTNSNSVNTNESTAITLTDTTTIVKGNATISKTQALCTYTGVVSSSNPPVCPASSGAASTALTVKPGDYVVYYLKATSTGTGNILATKVKDALPLGVSIYSLAATSTQAGTILYSIDGTTWVTSPTSLTVANGATVYAALDTNGDSTITTADAISSPNSILFRIKVMVNNGGTVSTTPVTDAQAVN
jgi:hypothetical protein